MGNRLMLYPNVLQLLAHRHGVPLERAHKLWDEAAEQSTAPVGLTPEDTPEWEQRDVEFPEGHTLRSAYAAADEVQRSSSGSERHPSGRCVLARGRKTVFPPLLSELRVSTSQRGCYSRGVISDVLTGNPPWPS